MKRLLAIMVAAAMLVACGGEKKKELTVEEQAKAKIEAVIEALEAGDMEKAEQLVEVCDEWYETLSEADQKKADKVMEQNEDRMIEAMMEYEDDLGCEGFTTGEIADNYAMLMLEALNNADSGTFAATFEECISWYEALDERDQQVVDNIMAEYEQEMMEAMKKVADDPDFAAIFAE